MIYRRSFEQFEQPV